MVGEQLQNSIHDIWHLRRFAYDPICHLVPSFLFRDPKAAESQINR